MAPNLFWDEADMRRVPTWPSILAHGDSTREGFAFPGAAWLPALPRAGLLYECPQPAN